MKTEIDPVLVRKILLERDVSAKEWLKKSVITREKRERYSIIRQSVLVMYLKSYQAFNTLEKHGGIGSGSSGGILVEVRVFSSAPSIKSRAYSMFTVSLFLFSFIHPLV